MANAYLCMFVNARKYVSGLTNEKSIMPMSVRSLRTRAKLMTPERQRERERDRETETTIKHRGLYCTFFQGGSLKKARSQLAKFCLNKNYNKVFIV